MKGIQAKIVSIVTKYIRRHYDEYSAVCKQIKDKREKQKNEFASTGEDSYLGQLAFEVPQTLDLLLQELLSDEEWGYYKSLEGTLWFARRYPEFSPAVKI